MRYRGAGCVACAEACPAEAMGLAEITLEVSDACTGCGRCVAACPMGALAIDGFSDVGAAQGEPGPPSVECWRVPTRDRAEGAVAVPCLGGIDAAWLIERHRTPGDGPVLMDRGWCAACPSGGCEQPAAAAVAQARGLLETMGVPPSRLPRIRTAALPLAVAPQADAHADSEIRISRRAFFGRLTRGAGEAVAPLLPAQAVAADPRLARPPRRSRARSRLLAACIELSRARGLPMPYTLFRRASAAAACCSRGVCAAVCPTGALFTRAPEGGAARRAPPGAAGGFIPPEPDETAQERVFNAVDCIACGACLSACPESASQLDERMDEGWRSEAVLWRLAVRECEECGASFTAREGETLCDPCGKSRRLARDMFRQFFVRPAREDDNHQQITTQGG